MAVIDNITSENVATKASYRIDYPDGPPGWVHEHWDYEFPYNLSPNHQEDYTYHSGPYGLTGQVVGPAGNFHKPDPSMNTFTWMSDNAQINPSAVRGAVRDSFARIKDAPEGASDPVFIQEYALVSDAAAGLDWWVNIDPMAYAPGQSPTPGPVPWWIAPLRVTNPRLSPTEQSERGYSIASHIGANTSPAPYTETTFQPGAQPSVRPNPRPDLRKPPTKGEKERKTIATPKAASYVAKVVSAVTESLDVVNAAYDALPEKLRKQLYARSQHGKDSNNPVSAKNKIKAVYTHWDDVDVKEFLTNLAKNEVEDRLIGGINQRIAKNNRPWYNQSRRPVGWSTGPAL